MKGISVIIPTLNRVDFLKQTIDCLVSQKFEHPYEILIVDQSNKEDKQMLEYQERYSCIRYYHITFFKGLPEARNFGWQKAKYDYILYLDDDITCESNLLEEHYRFIHKESIGVVAGGITEKHNKNTNVPIGKFTYWTATPYRGFHQKEQKEVFHAGGGNFCVKKTILENVGGVDENLTKGAALYEETDFCLRVKNMGFKIYFNYDAHVYHLAATTGGCRVEDINKYIYALSRNRTIIITRYLKWYHKLTANLFLLKLIMAYAVSYKKTSIIKNYIQGRKEGLLISKQPIKCTIYE